jgi:hypothetical protein
VRLRGKGSGGGNARGVVVLCLAVSVILAGAAGPRPGISVLGCAWKRRMSMSVDEWLPEGEGSRDRGLETVGVILRDS